MANEALRLTLPSEADVPEFTSVDEAIDVWGEAGVVEALNRYLDQQRAHRKYRTKKAEETKLALATVARLKAEGVIPK